MIPPWEWPLERKVNKVLALGGPVNLRWDSERWEVSIPTEQGLGTHILAADRSLARALRIARGGEP